MPLTDRLIGALIFTVASICGAILIREKIRKKALEDYDFRREKEYRQIEKERDEWIATYEWEHGLRIADEAIIRVQTIILDKTKVRDLGGRK